MESKEALEKIKDFSLSLFDADGEEEDYIRFGQLEPNLIEPIERDLEILELLREHIKVDIFGRICYVPILEERNGILQDLGSEKILRWLKNETN